MALAGPPCRQTGHLFQQRLLVPRVLCLSEPPDVGGVLFLLMCPTLGMLGASGPGGGAAKESDPRFWRERTPRSARRTRAPEGTPRSPRPLSRRSRARSTSTNTSRREPSTCSGLRWSAALSCPASAHGKWWARRSSRPPGATCAGSEASRGGTRCSRLRGGTMDKATCLQLVMDEPPEQLYNQWIRDRMEFYERVEPTEPPRDERLVLGDASAPRLRFSSSNGLGNVSTALWSVILSNPEKSGLAAIHSVAKEAILKGESR